MAFCFEVLLHLVLLILNELEKFHLMLEQMRTKVRGQIDEQIKELLINQVREEAIKSFQNMFKK